ncbi:MAG TPA: hypothetical protein VG477_08635 [Thermoanaerobaculia bacterium]|nr:hypothetical protein [Thermoanaerobaculia bacterium]
MGRRNPGPTMNRSSPTPLRLCLLLPLLVAACAPGEPSPVPTDRPLVRLDGDWLSPPPGAAGERTAPATVLMLRSGGELVELHGWIYGPDESPRFSALDGYVVAAGRWEHEGSVVRTRRERVHHSAPLAGDDPLCAKPAVDFEILEGSLLGDAGVGTVGVYAPANLPRSEVDSYAGEVRSLGRPCGG